MNPQIAEVITSLLLVLSSLQIELDQRLEKKIIHPIDNLTFFELPFELQQVALCESSGIQSIGNKTLKSKTGDLGIMQINERVHGKTALSLGLNLHDPNDNMEYGLWLYKKNGLKDWKASRHCWSKKLTLK